MMTRPLTECEAIPLNHRHRRPLHHHQPRSDHLSDTLDQAERGAEGEEKQRYEITIFTTW